MRKSLSSLLFHDEELDTIRDKRDPVLHAIPSSSAKKKKETLKTKYGLPVNSFDSIIKNLGTISRNKCRIKSSKDTPLFYHNTQLSLLQKKVFELLGLFSVNGKQ